jgi:hypothetical protein
MNLLNDTDNKARPGDGNCSVAAIVYFSSICDKPHRRWWQQFSRNNDKN